MIVIRALVFYRNEQLKVNFLEKNNSTYDLSACRVWKIIALALMLTITNKINIMVGLSSCSIGVLT